MKKITSIALHTQHVFKFNMFLFLSLPASLGDKRDDMYIFFCIQISLEFVKFVKFQVISDSCITNADSLEKYE